jgi:alpha-D-ribose 1-methylphosphonate 5-triphosphate synthase subunit PhnG
MTASADCGARDSLVVLPDGPNGTTEGAAAMVQLTSYGVVAGRSQELVEAAVAVLDSLPALPQQSRASTDLVRAVETRLAGRRPRLDDLLAAVRFDYCELDALSL